MIAQVWPEAGVVTVSGEAENVDKVYQDILEKIKAAIEVQNQIDVLRAQQVAELQQAAMIIETMDPGGSKPQITIYKQRDPQWNAVYLGTSQTTIGRYGCLMTCAASILTDAGRKMQPDTLNAWLTINGGYGSGNRFVFNAIDKLNVITFDYMIDCPTRPAPMQQLDAEIKAGRWIIVKVDFNPVTLETEEHWVRYLGNGEMMDPWVGDIAPIVPRYRGATAAEAILRAAIYKPKPTI